MILALGFLFLNFMLFFVTKKAAYIPFFVVPFMIISVFIWSRGFCGWACPRAAFLERFLKPVSLKKPVPKWMQSLWVSAIIFIVLISRVTYVGINKGLLAAGFLLCVVPTVGAILVGWYSPKSWCAICPTGTLMKFIDMAVRKFKVRKNSCEGVQGDIEVIGINTCGGCPGKKAVIRAAEMIKRGADTIVLASCITRGNPIGFACPHAGQMKDAIKKRIGDEVALLDWTH